MKPFIPPAPDEERIYFINRVWDVPLRVVIKGVPPCLWCGEPVTRLSADGPLVCPPCDMGVNKDGDRWTNEDYARLSAHFREAVEAYADKDRQ